MKPCEYCGKELPDGVDKATRRIRSAHFQTHSNERAEQAKIAKMDETLLSYESQIIAEKAKVQELVKALKDVTVHLIAAHSLLGSGGKKAAGSDKMFAVMLSDYEKSFEIGRAAFIKYGSEK